MREARLDARGQADAPTPVGPPLAGSGGVRETGGGKVPAKEGEETMDMEDSGQLPQAFAGLRDVRGVMGEAAEHVADLGTPCHALSAAFVQAGLPEAAWRAPQASLHLLSASLPEVSVGTWLARVERFARHDGLAWLHGTARDLGVLQEEVAHLSAIAGPLCEAVQRLQRPTIGNRADRPLQRVFSSPDALPPLQDLTELLADLEALAPFLRPLAARDWPALTRGQHAASDGQASSWLRAADPARIEPSAGVAFAPTRRLGGVRLPAALSDIVTTLRARVSSLVQQGASRLRPPQLRRRWQVAGALGVLLLAVAALVLTHPPSPSSTASHVSGTAAGGAHRATPHPTPTSQHATSAPQATEAPAVQLSLTCVVQGTTATLTIRDAGTSELHWQAKPPPTLRVTPAQGTLEAGQTAMAQVSAVHKKTATGTVVVTATQGGASTSSSVDCH
jgi:hypothetical protein